MFNIKRVLSIVGLSLIWTVGPWYIALLWCALHIIFFRGVEVIFVALLVDVFYLTVTSVPWYTLIAISGLILYEWIHTTIFIYNR